MMNRFKQISWTTMVAVACCVTQPQTASAQLEFLKGLFGGKSAPAQRKLFQPFQGHQALQQAIVAAESGEVEQSLKLAAEAFKDGGVNDPLEHPENLSISPNVLRMSKVWAAKGAKPDEVVAVLIEVVLPSKTPGVVRPYVGQWPLNYDELYLTRSNGRVPATESVGAELIRWAVLAKQTGEVTKRLQAAIKAEQPKEAAKPNADTKKSDKREGEAPAEPRTGKDVSAKDGSAGASPSRSTTTAADKAEAAAKQIEAAVARVFAVQLAVAERDVESANKSLTVLLDDAKSANGPLLDYLCHAVSTAVREPKSEAAGLKLLEAVLDRAEQVLPAERNGEMQSGLRGNAPWLRVHAANAHARAGRAADAKRCVAEALGKPIGARYGAEYSAYLTHTLKLNGAAALIDAGLIVEGLELAGEAPDPRAVRYFRADGAINIAAKVGQALRKLAPAERYELLRKWALPSDDRNTVRSVVDFVPQHEPTRFVSGTALAAGHPPENADSESPVASAIPLKTSTSRLGSGVLSDVYSTDWELVATARELGKLDELIRELSSIVPQTPSVNSLRTLAMVVRDGSANAAKSGESGTTKSGAALGASTTTTRLKALLDATTAAVPGWEVQVKPMPPLETYVIAAEAAIHPEWRETAEAILFRLIEHSQRTQSQRPRDHFRMAWLETLRLRSFDILPNKEVNGRAAGAGEVGSRWLKTMPKLWDSIGFESATERAMGALPPTWFAHDGYLSHVSNSRQSDLVFGLPLGGSFELTLECREGNWSEGRAGYGGASCEIFAYQDTAHLHGKGNSGYEGNPKLTNLLHKEPWNRYTIRVHDGHVKYYANGQPVFEDTPGAAAPWLTLGAMQGFTPSYRNLRISGSPTIPREVALLGDERLRGWVASYFDESKPDALQTRKYISVKIEQNGQTYNTIVEDDGTMEGEPAQMGRSDTDWTFADGELRSTRRSSFFGGESPSLLTYQRPLRDGEMVSFEFWHQPGVTTAQPTFGEVVYALGSHASPERGRTTETVAKNTADRATNAPTLWRGVATTVVANADLKTGWSSIAMSLNGGLFEIELNGKEVVSEKIEPTNSRRIGFFHDAAQTDLRIRNVVLSGDWPKEFDAATRAAIESPEPIEKLANSRFLTYALGEDRLSDNAYEVARQAVKLDTAERYKFLYRWVIPNESHDLLRTTGALTPTHPAPPTIDSNPIDVATLAARNEVDQRFVQTGGNFVSPAILLVLAAAELNRLDELRQTVEAFNPASSGEMARNRAAMLGIIALLADDTGEAILRIRECQTLLVQHKPTTMYSRWGDAALASLAVHHPLTREAAIELLEFIIKHQVQAGNPGVQEFVRFVRQLHGLAMYLGHGGTSEEFGTQPKSKQWRAVSQPRARSRGEGFAVASYDTIAGEMALRGGHDYDAAYFQSPLRGDYEVSCRLSHFDWREIQLMGAGIANALKHTHNEVKVSHPKSAVRDLPLEKPITPRVQQWHDYKLVVKGGRFTSFVNGQKLYEAELTAEHDPWLAIVGWAGQSSRAVRDLVITGKPTIPKEINLLGSKDLIGWMTDYYASEWGQQVFEWTLEADGVMQAPQQTDANPGRDRRKVENIIRYHRPMLEDGEISYEFYYDPEVKVAAPPNQNLSYLGANAPKRTLKGKTLVHPALDRMVCLLEPDGVKIHWLTDGRWDRTGLTADNVSVARRSASRTDDAERRPTLPLKPREWNAIKFRTKADTLTIELNGETVFSHDIEPTNLRHFGLFHYANESNVKVRNIRYRGDWPTKLPSVADQELAGGPLKKAAIPDADLPDSMTWDFTKSKFDRAEFQSVWNSNADKFITATDAGLRYSMPAGEKKPQVAGIAPLVHIGGDFIATMDYDGLKTVAAEEHWGSGIAFNAGLDNSYQIGIEVRHVARNFAKVTSASAALVSASRPNYFHNESISEFPPAGRLRLQRKGAVIYYLIAAPGSENFRLITHRPCGTQDIKYLAINADASDTPSGSEFVVKNLSIRASKILKVK
ncbi:MAG: DUF1583 domain-containing protein [Planctomycetaceae bacterium]